MSKQQAQLQCKICNLEFDSKKPEEFEAHQKLEHETPCKHCNLKFVTIADLESHKLAKHEAEYHKEKIDDLKNMLSTKGSAVNDLFSTRKPRYDLINSWAEHLEKLHDLGVYKDPIGTIATNIKMELTKIGVHAASIDYVHRVLPYKYKNASKIRGENLQDSVPQNSSEEIATVREENKILLDWIKRRKEFFDWLENILSTNHYWSILDEKEKIAFEQFLYLEDVSYDVAKDSFDSRQSVPVRLQLMLVSALSAATINHGGGFFLEKIKIYGSNKKSKAIELVREIAFYKLIQARRAHKCKCYYSQKEKETIENLEKILLKTEKDYKEKDELTSKQTGKTMAGFIKRIFKPLAAKNRDEAIFADFLGLQCSNCGAHNVGERQENESDPNSFRPFCFTCEEFFEGKTISKCRHCYFPFYDEILAYMLQTATKIDETHIQTKCPNSSCGNDLIIPRAFFPREPSVPQMRARILQVMAEIEAMPKSKIITAQLIADKLDSVLATNLKPIPAKVSK